MDTSTHLQNILDKLDEVVFEVNTAGKWIYLNSAWSRLTGYRLEDSLGQAVTGFLHPDCIEQFNLILQQGFSGQEKPERQALQFLTRSGNYCWLKIDARRLENEAGAAPSLAGTLGDFSEQKKAEAALGVSQALLQTFVEHSPAAVCMVDTEMRHIIASHRWLVDYNLGHQNIIGKSHYEIFPTLPESWKEIHKRCLAGAIEISKEDLFLREDNSINWLRWEVHPWYTGSGKIGGLIMRSDVITERKQAEQALQQSEARNRAYVRAIPDLLFRIHRNGTYTDYKAEQQTIHLLIASDIIGRNVQDVLPPELARQTMYYIEQALQTGKTQNYEYQLMLNNRLNDFEARVVVCGEDETLFIVRDVNERKKVERLKAEFISNVNHELRTPLTSIRGSLGLVVDGLAGELPVAARGMLDIAYQNSERLVRLINDILDVQKIESDKLKFNFIELDLGDLVEQTLAANQGYAEKFKVKFRLHPPVHRVIVKGDCERLMQVITNLLSNAAKFSPDHDEILVKLELNFENVRVAITDHGLGISEEFQSIIFQKFAQADSSDTRSRVGTGLGLSISKSIVEQHGGSIGFESLPGISTTFYFDLPVLSQPGQITNLFNAYKILI